MKEMYIVHMGTWNCAQGNIRHACGNVGMCMLAYVKVYVEKQLL